MNVYECRRRANEVSAVGCGEWRVESGVLLSTLLTPQLWSMDSLGGGGGGGGGRTPTRSGSGSVCSSRCSSAAELESGQERTPGVAGTGLGVGLGEGRQARARAARDSRTPPARKARRVRFFRNGDRFHGGCVVPVLTERYRTFDSLTADLTRILADNVTLPNGVRTIFSLDGKKVLKLEDLEDGKSYVCSGKGEIFKKLDYNAQMSARLNTPESNNTTLNTTLKTPNNRLSRLFNDTGSPYGATGNGNSAKVISNEISVVRPRIVTIIRNGIKPRKIFRLLLNKRNSPTFEHVLGAFTECIKLDTGCVRRVFTIGGRPVLALEHFFGSEEVFFAYGNERYSQEDFELEFEETKTIQTYKKPLTVRNGSKNGPRPEMWKPVKTGENKAKDANGGSSLDLLSNSDASTLILPEPLRSKYSIGKFIGDGNFAVVRVCKDRDTGKEYAMKIIDKDKCRGKEHYLETEVKIMRQLCHPRIVSLIAEQDTPDWLYLVLELVRGGDLFDSIAAAYKFCENRARLMIRHLASAMAYLHCMGIVHRDIKPENLLVEVEGDQVVGLKLGDFGLACEVTKPLYTICGTPTYIAPEILLESGYGFKIDVWAAGVILYILLCGFPPFVAADGDQEALFNAILNGRYDFPSKHWVDVSQGARDLITNMLQWSPILRFSAEDVLDDPWLAGDCRGPIL
ncbi:serine/threonine-protein kinase GA29083 [Arctopsyche grandis]|uniref:serine/threonine-protein kinase GA29083 n=1 Tax=Arctopsyche grandis TaxID=121162 RepID=UPI00406D6BCC